jgi:hypothetical protein
MKNHNSKSFNTNKFGSFIFGYNLKSFGIGFRIDAWGTAIDFGWLWFGWER